MGLAIKRNAKGLYKAKSTISDESVSDVWLTEDEFKTFLIKIKINAKPIIIVAIEINPLSLFIYLFFSYVFDELIKISFNCPYSLFY